MSEGRDKKFLLGCVLCASLLAAAVSVALATHFYRQEQFRMLSAVCGEIEEGHPEAVQTFFGALKEYKAHPGRAGQMSPLSSFGYRPSDLLPSAAAHGAGFAGIGFFAAGAVFLWLFWYQSRVQERRISRITEYLEQVGRGEGGTLFPDGDDAFSRLQDEIDKTVAYASQTREEALRARDSFARNLSNIAHQLKTPITAISLSTQMLKAGGSKGQRGDSQMQNWQRHLEQIQGQLARLTRLEESLLLLSRIDAGALPLAAKAVDVLTLLSLGADNLQELCSRAGVVIEIPEMGEAIFTGDLEWTMEAVMNLMKNCVEHTESGGRVYTSYEQNPLYVRIRIWDQGKGFSKEDLPHLFERFYRGKDAKEGGIGIGLSRAKEIIERQKGVVRAGNRPDGGASFEIRFYCH